MHPVGFIIRIYYDARSPERRILHVFIHYIIIVDGLGMWRVWVRRGRCIGSCWGNRKERGHWGDLGVDGWIISECISRWWDVGIWTGLGWPRIETCGGRL